MPATGNLQRGNILVWEQSLPIACAATAELEVRMEPQSILYRTLMLFASMLARGGPAVRGA